MNISNENYNVEKILSKGANHMIYTINQIEKIRGFHALTQNEERLMDKLLSNINTIGGKKAIGFKKTRLEVLTTEFDREALEECVEICLEITESIGNKKANDSIRKIVKNLFERVCRDHVPMDMVTDFRLAIVQRVELNGGNVEKAIEELEHYFTCGKVIPVAESYRQACKELEEGKVIYFEPTTIAI
jgi:hypothetical protein